MINAYCNETATLIKSGGYDAYTRPNATTTETIKTKYFDKKKLITGINGEQVVSSGYFLIPKTYTMTNEDKITFNSTDYIIISIENSKDFSQRLWRVWVQ